MKAGVILGMIQNSVCICKIYAKKKTVLDIPANIYNQN